LCSLGSCCVEVRVVICVLATPDEHGTGFGYLGFGDGSFSFLFYKIIKSNVNFFYLLFFFFLENIVYSSHFIEK
jgi:hypothetical protein